MLSEPNQPFPVTVPVSVEPISFSLTKSVKSVAVENGKSVCSEDIKEVQAILQRAKKLLENMMKSHSAWWKKLNLFKLIFTIKIIHTLSDYFFFLSKKYL